MPCAPFDAGCYVMEQLAPYMLSIFLAIVGFIMLFFKRIRVLGALILIGLFLWHFGIPTIVPPFSEAF